MIVDTGINDRLDQEQMLKSLLVIEGLISRLPEDPLTDGQHPLHKAIGQIYEIAHSGHQLCKGCGSGNSSQKQSLEEGVQYLKDTNFCDVEKIIRERS